jgi:nucleotide-binding universal stress UspA family protein
LENDTLEGMVLRNGEWGMKKVLVAVDGSDKSLEAADYAISIANNAVISFYPSSHCITFNSLISFVLRPISDII